MQVYQAHITMAQEDKNMVIFPEKLTFKSDSFSSFDLIMTEPMDTPIWHQAQYSYVRSRLAPQLSNSARIGESVVISFTWPSDRDPVRRLNPVVQLGWAFPYKHKNVL